MLNRILFVVVLILFANIAIAGSYEDAVAKWDSYQDVANWLKSNFSFDQKRQKLIGERLKKQGPSGLLFRNPATLYEKDSRGYCADAAYFSIESLNTVDPSYNARWVFIQNEKGKPNHWVAAFDLEGKLYIMDYGTGKKWEEMQGIHGPYDSLDGYRDYLSSLSLPGFKVGKVVFRDMPGQED